jgi:septal ring factor EnvC (AmiA/AmiB activator)
MRRGKSGAVALVFCFVAVITIAGIVTFKDEEKKEPKKDEYKEEQIVEREEQENEEIQFTQGDNVQAEIERPSVEETDAPVKEKTFSFSEDTTMKWPLDGNVIMNYSMDESIYFATLDQYKYNPAIMISGEEGSEVWAAESGKIKTIEEDSVLGTKVVIDMGNGYEAIYGQLEKLAKKEGDIIEKGELLGYLAKPTKYFVMEGPNLYFEIRKDGQPVNPLEYMDAL